MPYYLCHETIGAPENSKYLVAIIQPIQFYSCLISYSGKDEEYARRLYERMRGEEQRVWFAPEDLRRGEKIVEQIDRAIQVNDRLLVVLSKHSMQSEAT